MRDGVGSPRSFIQQVNRLFVYGANLTAGRGGSGRSSKKTDVKPANPSDQKPGDAFDRPRPARVNENLDAIPACWGSVEILSTALSNSRLGVARMVDPIKERYTWMPEHRVSHLLANPSRLFHPWQTRQMTFEQFIRGGNGYFWIRRDTIGRAVELVPAYPSRAWWEAIPGTEDGTVRLYDLLLAGAATGGGYSQEGFDDGGQFYQSVRYGGTSQRRRQRVPSWDVASFHGLGFDGLSSPSPILYAAAAALETARSAIQHNLGTLAQGLHANRVIVGAAGALESMAGLVREKEDLIKIAREIETIFSGAVNAGKTPSLPFGFDIKDLGGFSAVDLELVKLLEWTVDDVVRVFGVPKWLLSREATPKKLDQSGETFSRFSLQHRRRNIEDELTIKLLSPMERARGLAVRMDTTHYALGSLTDRAMVANQLVARTGILTINEGRELVNLPPIEGGDKLIQPQGAPEQNGGGNNNNDDPDQADRAEQVEENTAAIEQLQRDVAGLGRTRQVVISKGE